MTAEIVVPSRPRAWYRLLWLLVVLAGTCLLLGIWWYYNTADLAAVREAAKQYGLPTTADEWGRVVSPASEQAYLERLGIISKSLKDYDSELTLKKIPGDPKRDRLRPFLPIPPAAREFHTALDQAGDPIKDIRISLLKRIRPSPQPFRLGDFVGVGHGRVFRFSRSWFSRRCWPWSWCRACVAFSLGQCAGQTGQE